jgi:hypothetical protein
MRENKAEDEPSLRGQDPKRQFYMAVSVNNNDGSTDVREGIEVVCETEAEAVEVARGVNTEYADLECYVYRCAPVARVWRGKTRTTKLSR